MVLEIEKYYLPKEMESWVKGWLICSIKLLQFSGRLMKMDEDGRLMWTDFIESTCTLYKNKLIKDHFNSCIQC